VETSTPAPGSESHNELHGANSIQAMIEPILDYENDEEVEEFQVVDGKPIYCRLIPSRQIRTQRTKHFVLRRGKVATGVLSVDRLVCLPLDVLIEVASHLLPTDLLQLSRASQRLRRMFLSKSLSQVWRSSLRAAHAPVCPADLSEPQFSSFLFDNLCHACGCSSSSYETCYTFKVRLCKDCFRCNFRFGSQIAREAFEQEVANDVTIYKIMPFFKADRDMALWEEHSMSDLPYPSREFFFKPDFIQVVRQYLEQDPVSEQRRKFVERRLQYTTKYITDGVKLQAQVREMIRTQANERKAYAREGRLK